MTPEEKREYQRRASARYYAEHRDEINARRKQDRIDHPEKYQQQHKRAYLKYTAEMHEQARIRSAVYHKKNRDAVLVKRRARWAARRDVLCAQLRAFRKTDPERVRKWEATKYAKHRDKINARSKAWAKAHPWVGAAATMKRYLAERRATPSWSDLNRIKAIYKQAAELTAHTGVLYNVDHIIPIQGKTICGLHVHYNLQILTKSENVRKANHLPTEIPVSCAF